MNEKLLEELKSKNLQLPVNYKNLDFDYYELSEKDYFHNTKLKLYLKRNLKVEITYYDNGNKIEECHYDNSDFRNLQRSSYTWEENGKLSSEEHLINGDGKQYQYASNDYKVACEWDIKNWKPVNIKTLKKEK